MVVSTADGLPVRCVGKWARQKIHFLTQYLGIFGQGMKNKWEGNLHYIEICSGPGRCVVRGSSTEIDGTALAVLGHPAFSAFYGATFIDYSTPVVTALNERIQRMDLAEKASAVEADYNVPDKIAAIVSERVPKGLTLVFIDPTDCSVPFDTVAAIARALPNTDFIINLALGTDVTRNIKPAILDEESEARKKYTRFLGGDEFFRDPEVCRLAQAGKDEQLRIKFRGSYRTGMDTLGYRYFAVECVEHYYDLLFASRVEKGLDFWRRAQKYRPDNQATFDL